MALHPLVERGVRGPRRPYPGAAPGLRELADEPPGVRLLDRAVVDLADQCDETNLGEHHAHDE